ncbi:MAG TPA: biopolymer transporter ExbD [Allosphingosinicella sp.]|jgi:biopolymer transport protein ExbD|nr:biopolymer transporter ExbD [Allosphingosinicella sp.]
MTISDKIPAAILRQHPPRIRFVPAKGDFAPIVAINTTPLVDVMLVLLIMFIIVIPAATHKVPLDLPQPGPVTAPPPPSHRLDIAADGALVWDGAALPAAALPARLAALAADPARPELNLNAAGEARYEQVDIILAQIRGAGITRLGFIDNARYRNAF